MPDQQVMQPIPISEHGHYSLSDDVRYVDLQPGPHEGKFRIRFSQGPATILDILVSAETLGLLARSLVPYVEQNTAEFQKVVSSEMRRPSKRPE